MEAGSDKISFRILQQQEVDGAALYERIARLTKEESEWETLQTISREESRHAATFAKYTGCKLKPRHFWLFWNILAARILGYTFIIQKLENGEDQAIEFYRENINAIPELKQILEDEEHHEQELLDMLDEERLHYLGDMVLGMNDALVELTGSLAGYTLAMQNTHVIAMAGLITGVSATLSMAASGYLSSREAGQKDAAKSATYTGTAYLVTVALLIIPYLILPSGSYLWALGITLLIAVTIIAGFNYYISIAKGRPFRRNFLVMAGISLGVATISFVVGLLVKNVLGIDL
ncbi:VIT1/CCC1 transporter family protein [Eubacteriales bacterium mix99]|jgi:VIT1/CCC1 family predicted Fe2+/Mn2+ transporter|nr:rubrerythrin family protein [Clostridiales bacterium]